MNVNVGELPVWQGVRDEPGFTSSRFEFGVSQGIIRRILPVAEQNQITDLYSDDSYNFITAPPGTSEWGDSLGEWYIQLLRDQVGSLAGKTVLEIGSGTLYVAERVTNEMGAVKVYACDPAIREEPQSDRVEVLREYFTYPRFSGKLIDLVLAINNLEHIPDPVDYLNNVRLLLEESKGYLYLVVPDCSRGLLTGDLGFCVHEHLSFFTPETLSNVLSNNGFSISWMHAERGHIFALVQPSTDVIQQVDYLKHAENLLGTFGSRFSGNIDSARRLISEKTALGPVGIHGCSVGINTMLALLGLSSNPSIFLFDGDPQKVGKYLPAFDKPILAATDQTYKVWSP